MPKIISNDYAKFLKDVKEYELVSDVPGNLRGQFPTAQRMANLLQGID